MAKDIITRLKLDATQHNSELAKAKSSLQKFGQQNLTLNGIMGQSVGALAKWAGGIGLATSAISMLQSAVQSNITTALGFEKSISQLSSLTGKTGEDLNELKQKAIELGATTTQTASQVAESFQLIGSKMPELLKSASALQEVTRSAITLAEASGGDVTTSANALTAALNIMGEGASQADRYINVLAAGSQKGTRNIQELSDIIFRAGQSARSTGINFEQLIAIAAAGTKEFDSAESAGQALSKFFIQLEKQSDDQLKPSVVGLGTALQNLAEKDYGVVEATKLFTKNGAMAYRSIVNNKDAILETLPAISGTNTAIEQAKTNTNNLDGSLKSLSSAWEGLNLHINDSNGFLKDCVDWLKDVVTWADQTFTELGRVQRLRDQLAGGGDGQPTRVQSELSALRGSNHKEQKRSAIGHQYDLDIQEQQSIIAKATQDARNGLVGQQPIIDAAKKKLEILKELKEQFWREATTIINGNAAPTTNPTKTTTTTEYDDSTDQGIRDHIKALKAQRDEVQKDSAEYANLTLEITRLQAALKTDTKEKTRLQEINAEIAKLENAYVKASDTEKASISAKIQTLDKEKKKIEETIKALHNQKPSFHFTEESLSQLQILEDQLQTVQNSMKGMVKGSEDWKAANDEAQRLTNTIKALNGEFKNEKATYTLQVNDKELQALQQALGKDAVIEKTVNVKQKGEPLKIDDQEVTAKVNVKQTGEPLKLTDQTATTKVKVEQSGEPLKLEDQTATAKVKVEQEGEPFKLEDQAVTAKVKVEQEGEPFKLTDQTATAKVKVEQEGEPLKLTDQTATATINVKQKGEPLKIDNQEATATINVKQKGEPLKIDNQEATATINVKQKGEPLKVDDQVHTITVTADTAEAHQKIQKLTADKPSIIVDVKANTTEATEKTKAFSDIVKGIIDKSTSIGDQYTNVGKSVMEQQQAEFSKYVQQYDQLKVKIEEVKLANASATEGQGIVSAEAIAEAEAQLDGLKSKIEEIGPAIQANLNFEQTLESVSKVSSAFSGLDGAVSSVESVVNAWENADDALGVFHATMQTVTTALGIFNTVMTTVNTIQSLFKATTLATTVAETGEAMAAGVSAGAKGAEAAATLPAIAANKALTASFLEAAAASYYAAHAYIPFAGFGIASGFVSASVAATKAVGEAGAFADGGVVGGNSYSGDRLYARVNSSEVILNQDQAQRALDMMEPQVVGGGGGNSTISGEDIVTVINNYGRRTGRGEILK